MPPVFHSKVGASSCERWWNCPGSNALMAKLPPAAPSKFAAEGTAAHELCEKVLTNKIAHGCKWDATSMIGESIEADDFVFKVTDEMADAVNLYVDTILEDIKRIGCTIENSIRKNPTTGLPNAWEALDKATREKPYQPWTNIEKDFQLTDVDSDARGTNDASIFVPDETLIVYDFKYGAGIPVEAVENKQMLYYAIGAAGDKLMSFKNIELVIVQPRANHSNGPVRRWVTTPEYVAQFKEELKQRIAETRNPNANTCAGKWCRFCTAKLICPAMRDKSYELAKIDFQKPVSENRIKAPQELTEEELKLFLDNAELLENYIKEVKTYAEKLLESGKTIEGYKLVKSTKTHRKWNDTDENIASMLELELGADYDSLFTKTLKTPAQVEKMIKGSKELLMNYWFRPEGKNVLVREEDQREKQTPSAIADFQNLEDLGL